MAKNIRRLKIGNKVCAYLNERGYVGIGELIAEAVRQRDFVPAGQSKLLTELPLQAKTSLARLNNDADCDWCVGVRWIYKLKPENAVLKNLARRSAFQAMKQQKSLDIIPKAIEVAAVAK